MSDRTSFEEKNINEKVIESPPTDLDHGIVKDWDEEESAVTRKFVLYFQTAVKSILENRKTDIVSLR